MEIYTLSGELGMQVCGSEVQFGSSAMVLESTGVEHIWIWDIN